MTLTFSGIGTEALDDPASDPAVVERMLLEIATANRWFGGRWAASCGLAQLIDPADRALTLLDIGTGAGDLPRCSRAWAARRGIDLRIIGLERIATAARLAHRLDLPVFLGSGETLPVRDHSVDIVLLSQVVHHFDDDSVVLLLKEASRVARRGVIVAELRPSRPAALAYRITGALLGFHQSTITDGITSLSRGFDPPRIERLVVLAAGVHPTIVRRPFARITATWRTPG